MIKKSSTRKAYRQRRDRLVRRISKEFATCANTAQREELAALVWGLARDQLSTKRYNCLKDKMLATKRLREQQRIERQQELEQAVMAKPALLDQNQYVRNTHDELMRRLDTWRARRDAGDLCPIDAPDEFTLLRGCLVSIGRRAEYYTQVRGGDVYWRRTEHGPVKYAWAIRPEASWPARNQLMKRSGCWRCLVVYGVTDKNIKTYAEIMRYDIKTEAKHTVFNLTHSAAFNTVVGRFIAQRPKLGAALRKNEEVLYGKTKTTRQRAGQPSINYATC